MMDPLREGVKVLGAHLQFHGLHYVGKKFLGRSL